jgi:adenine deaminase
VVKDLKSFKVSKTFIDGQLVAENGVSLIENTEDKKEKIINNFNCARKTEEDFRFYYTKTSDTDNIKDLISYAGVIEALDGQLITNKIIGNVRLTGPYMESNVEEDILKIVVVNRYKDAPVAKAFIKNFGLKAGAIASSVAHDSHNIVAVGVDDESICKAVNLVIEENGGISCVSAESEWRLALPVAGLMSADDGYKVAEAYTAIDSMAKSLGSTLQSPFMTLSFMALLVIPHLKLSDLGLFDGDQFKLL